MTTRTLGKAARLSRGGMVVETSEGPIQFGAVPETIKDTMGSSGGVPHIYVIPDKMFSSGHGISLADLEFPIYFNYFARRRKTICICTSAQRKAIAAVMREAVFGPRNVDVAPEVAFGPVPGLETEMAYFRKSPFSGLRMELEDMLEFAEFDDEGRATVGQIEIRRRRDGKFAVRDQHRLVAEVPTDLPVPELGVEKHERTAPFLAPAFGITFIGTGHGFDPDTMTSGFIIWANHRGILIDPPVNSTEWMKQQEINPKLIDVVLLTHCHADHDGGTLQRILAEGRVKVYTTPTIMGSFVHKYRQLVGLERKRFEALFDFVPVSIGEPVRINGAEFIFHYTLHSVPCIGFEAFYHGKSLVYTSDTLYDPDLYDKLFDLGVVDEERRAQLHNFPWHHDLVLHEAGIPPIHTRVDLLAQQPPDVKARMMLIHISPRNLPEASGLNIAPAGLDGTVVLGEAKVKHSEAQEILDVLSHVDLFRDFPIGKAAEFYSMVRRRHYKVGDKIITKGSPGDEFFIIVRGKAVIHADDKDDEKVYGQYDYFGETALVLGVPRTADVHAKTDLEVLAIGRHDFLYLVRGTGLVATLQRLAHVRKLASWELLGRSAAFRQLTATQKTQLQSIMEDYQASDGEVLAHEGEKLAYAFLVAKGHVDVYEEGRKVFVLKKGDFSGEVPRMLNGGIGQRTLKAAGPVLVYRIPKRGMNQFLRKNPGVYMRLTETNRALKT
jgi:CRP-like cAMP-binding protein/phosphoribosyl 1,2-cyclic phosphodiesterase